jgi:type I restriction enzyme S subunit
MDVYANDYIAADLPFMEATASHAEIERFRAEAGDIMLTKDSETPDDIGIPAVVVEDIPVLVCGYHLALIKPKKDKVDSVYLAKQLGSKQTAIYFSKLANGSTRYGLSSSAIANTAIPLAPLPQQRRIAEILSTLDEAIEQTEALIAKMQQVKAGLMHDLFTRGVTPDGRLRPTREQAPELYKESPLGWIPKEWKVGRLDQYLDQQAGIKPGPFGSSLTKDSYVASGFKVYGQEQVIAGSLEMGNYYISEMKFRELSIFEVLIDDVLISLVGTVGCVLVAKPPFERGIINPRLMRLRPARGLVLPDFLINLLLSANVRRQLDILAGGGTMPVINGRIVRRLVVPLLSYDEQVKVASRIDALEEVISSTKESMAKLRQQKHGLMHDLLIGRAFAQ